jgi:hypothetical protein
VAEETQGQASLLRFWCSSLLYFPVWAAGEATATLLSP